MTYEEAVAWLQTMCEVPLNGSDENFQRILPAMFLYADGRIYRDLTFLITTITQPITLIARNREVVLPSSVRSPRAMNVCTPVGSITVNSTRKPLERIPAEVLDVFWPQSSYRPGVPQKWAIIGSVPTPAAVPPSQHVIRLMPAPDQAYSAEVLGDIRPDPLSSANPQTYLSVTYPELLLAACMIFAAGYQRDFGAQADDPQRAASWEQQYANLRAGIAAEAGRMRGMGMPAATEPGAP